MACGRFVFLWICLVGTDVFVFIVTAMVNTLGSCFGPASPLAQSFFETLIPALFPGHPNSPL